MLRIFISLFLSTVLFSGYSQGLPITVGVTAHSEKDSITVYYFMAEDCKICQYYTPTMRELYEAYNSPDMGFVGLFPNHFSSPDSIDAFKEKYAIPFTLKKEFFLTKTKLFDVTVTPEVVVYNETTEEILYKGRIDNSYYKLGRRRQVITSHELRDVLDDIKSGIEVDVASAPPIGCFISFRK